MNPYQYDQAAPFHGDNLAAAFADESARATFIRKTYLHVLLAVIAFVAVEAFFFIAVPRQTLEALIGRMVGGYGWLFVMGAYMVVSMVARRWAEGDQSRVVQYFGLFLYVLVQAVITLPLLYIAWRYDQNIPVTAALITGMVFAGLTCFVFVTRVDLHWMGKYLFVGFLASMGLIVASILMGFSLGILFSAAMVALVAGSILYDTSNVLHHYRTDQYVAASLSLFASLAVLFWYVLQLVMAFSSED